MALERLHHITPITAGAPRESERARLERLLAPIAYPRGGPVGPS